MPSSIRARAVLVASLVVGCSGPPAPVEPASAMEQQVLSLAAAKVPDDWTVPIEIAPQSTGAYKVTYWTPPDEIELLGPRQAVVDPATRKVELVLRD